MVTGGNRLSVILKTSHRPHFTPALGPRNTTTKHLAQEILLDGDNKVSACDMPSPLFGIELIADGKVSEFPAASTGIGKVRGVPMGKPLIVLEACLHILDALNNECIR